MIRNVPLRTARPAREKTLVELIEREHRRIAKLTRQRDSLQRRLVRARMRYSVLKRMANDQARAGL